MAADQTFIFKEGEIRVFSNDHGIYELQKTPKNIITSRLEEEYRIKGHMVLSQEGNLFITAYQLQSIFPN